LPAPPAHLIPLFPQRLLLALCRNQQRPQFL
jgi:hypothetical protein